MWQFLSVDFSPAFLSIGTTNETFQQSSKQDSSDTYWIVQLVCKKVQAHSSLEPLLEYNQKQTPLTNYGSLWSFQPYWEYRNICSFILVLEGETTIEIPESSRLEFLENFSANKFSLLDAEDNTSRLLNRGGTADLSLLWKLLAIFQKFPEPSFWEGMDSFVLLGCASLAASRTLLQWLLAFPNFTSESDLI